MVLPYNLWHTLYCCLRIQAINMKDILIAATFISLFHTTGVGQTLNQISILPANPTSADSIRIITDYTYYGS
jgi:hypothetical protein